MRVLVISHSYLAAENRKNLTALGKYVTVQAVVPDHVYDTVLGRISSDNYNDNEDVHIASFKKIALPRSQFLLVSLDLSMRKYRPDIVHVEYDPWSIIFWQVLFARKLFARKAKIVCTVKKNTYRRLPIILEFTKNAIAKFFIKSVDQFIAVNQGVKGIYIEKLSVPEEKLTVIQHLGVDTQLFQPVTATHSSKLVIGYCGRLDAHKGIDQLLEAVQSARIETGKDLQLSLLGDGRLHKSIGDKNEPWIKLCPPVRHGEVANFMQGLDIFIMPALITPDHEEHDGHALMEAMACGIASIATTSGILPEMLDNKAGLTVPAGDIPALSSAISRVVSDEKLRRKLARNAKNKVAKYYSLQSIASRKVELYRKVIQ